MRARIFAEENKKWWTLGALSFALFMIMLDNTVVNVALPSIKRDLGISQSELEWTVAAYALTFASLLLTGGKLGDLVGRRLIFIIGLVVFTVSSLLCGLSGSAAELIGARAVQGVGAALMMPATLSIITATFAAKERGTAIGVWAGVSAMALAIGPLLGGVITEHISWNWIFYVNVPIGIGGVIAALIVIPESKDTSREQRLDLPGLLTSGLGLLALVYALIEANQYGWTSTRIMSLFVVSAILARGVRLPRTAPAAADARPLALQERHVCRREPGRDPGHDGDVRDLRLLPALHADAARLVADPGRRRPRAVDADGRHLRPGRRKALRPRGLPLAHGRRHERGCALLPAAVDDLAPHELLAPAARHSSSEGSGWRS